MSQPDRNDGRTSTHADASLQALASLDWPGPERNRRIEEFLMHIQQKATHQRARAGIWLGVAAVLLGGAVYGGVRLYDRYIVKMNVNGKESVHEVEALPDGNALVEVPLEGGGTARILVGPENVGEDGRIRAGITIQDAGSGEATQTVTIEAIPPGGATPTRQPAKPDDKKDDQPKEPAPK